MTYVLWIIQGLLALLFLFGGIFKLVAPLEPIAQQLGVPVLLLRFIGLCEGSPAGAVPARCLRPVRVRCLWSVARDAAH